MRKPGFYWVKRKEWTIGEYDPNWGWDVIGSDERYEDDAFSVIGEPVLNQPYRECGCSNVYECEAHRA